MDQKKLNKPSDVKLKKKRNNTELYLRVINETNVTFSNDELTLINKALEYN